MVFGQEGRGVERCRHPSVRELCRLVNLSQLCSQGCIHPDVPGDGMATQSHSAGREVGGWAMRGGGAPPAVRESCRIVNLSQACSSCG